jgi:hypothetical protein
MSKSCSDKGPKQEKAIYVKDPGLQKKYLSQNISIYRKPKHQKNN